MSETVRRRVRLVWIFGCVLGALLPAAALAARSESPNMIFILVDDLRYDALGFVNPDVATPHLDELAKAGVYFPNAVVTTSLCSPSRATILTGQSARSHGIVDNNNAAEEGLHFFPQDLQQHGYSTAFVGKWHMGRASDEPRKGFDHWVSFKGQGNYYPTDRIPEDLQRQGVRHQLNVNGKHVAQQRYMTDELTDYALDWLQKQSAEQPFFLYLSHKAVHSDFLPAPRHQTLYENREINLPDPNADDIGADETVRGAGKPVWVKNQRNSWHGVDFPYHSDLSIAEYVQRYYATLAAVDDSVGRIVAWLEQTGMAEDTVLLFFSDNGFLFGDHGLIDKRNAYEPSVRVPLLVYAPERYAGGREVKARVRNLDLAPTLLDMAGVVPSAHMEGQSFKALFSSASGQADVVTYSVPDFIYEYYWEWTFPQTPTTFAITRDEIKYIQYHGIWDLEELYDLNHDPEERINLITDPTYFARLTVLRKDLYRHLSGGDADKASGQISDQRKGARAIVPFTERRAAGIRFRRRSGSAAAEFPASFMKDADDTDLFSGFMPEKAPAPESTPAPSRDQ